MKHASDSAAPDSGADPSPPPSAHAVFKERLELAIRYREMLATDGITRGLIGPREVPRLWDRHIVNCGVLGEVIADGEYVIDIGSGAGLPGIPLALARPDLRITLVEPLLRRTTFLEEVVASLGLEVTVVRGRAEERAVRDEVGLADVVTSRAVAPLDRLAAWSAPLIRPGGRLVAIKGSSAPDEIDRDRTSVARRGLMDLEVRQCGVGVIEPPTTVVVGVRNDRVSGSQSSKKKRADRRSRSDSRGSGR
ncbi:16S rRNA (guanine(527)-N(7))-methyltransferase RsmG [Gordonia sp. L191]|uniref:16S rRNA (guanine(527)-N(7))-methyltransferase RsmG n=1 Tax=Gordonia sp. L191 TaxID=2982699 RepID=UPI0024C0583B|nr:16S rRNA (guanine(527)-N(7))-methyltransferase RsmG [Gordonia sp. L191]WHU46963.1 16S rRNA (guanine(527)-N(7))-methyltransferase RsmG [Gordonia sp. L191]